MKYIVKKPFGNVKVGEELTIVESGGARYDVKNSNMTTNITPIEVALMLNAGFLEESDGKCRPKLGDIYFVVDLDSPDGISESEWRNDGIDARRLRDSVMFPTKELAEAKLAEIKEVLRK